MSTTSGLISLQSRRQVGGGCSNNGGGYDFDLTLMFPSLKSTAIYTARRPFRDHTTTNLHVQFYSIRRTEVSER